MIPINLLTYHNASIVLITFLTLSTCGVMAYHVRHRLLHPLALLSGLFIYFIVVPAWYLLLTNNYAFGASLAHISQSTTIAIFISTLTYWLIVVSFCALRYDLSQFEFHPFSITITESPRTHRNDREHNRDRRQQHTNTNNRTRVMDSVIDSPQRFYRICRYCGYIGLSVGIIAYFLYVIFNGGFDRLLTIQPRTAFNHVIDTRRYLYLGKWGIIGGTLSIWLGYRPQIETRSTQSLSWYDYVGLASSALVMVGMTMTFRERFLILLCVGYLVTYCCTSDILTDRITASVGAGAIGLIMLFSSIEIITTGHTLKNVINIVINTLVHVDRFELFIVIIDHVPSQVSYQFGQPILSLFGIMPVEPYGDIVEVMATGVDEPYHTSSGMLFGEIWLYFGPYGLFSAMWVFGSFLGLIDRVYTRSTHSTVNSVYSFALVALFTLLVINIEWAISQIIIPLGAVLCSVCVSYVYCRFINGGHIETNEALDND